MAKVYTPVNLYPSDELFDVGKSVQLDENADRGARITNKMQTYMNKIDLIPVRWSLNYPKSKPDEKDKNADVGSVKLDYDSAIDDYEVKCSMHGLEAYKGVRIWSISDSQFQESFSNEFSQNVIEKTLNDLSGTFQNARTLLKSVGYNVADTETMIQAAGVEAANKFKVDWQKMVANNQKAIDAASPAVDLMSSVLLNGKQMSLPKIWVGSNYSPALNVTIKLSSPYGSPTAIKECIVRPLLHLILLGSPTTENGMTYGDVGYVQVHAYGSSNINIGYIQNITIQRAGSDITYNKYQQPLSVIVTLSILPAVDGFAALVAPKDSAMAAKILKIDEVMTDQPYQINNETTFAMTTTNDLIKSFKKMPGTSSLLDGLLAELTSPLTSLTNNVRKTISDTNKEIQSGISGAIGSMASEGSKLVGAGKSKISGMFS